MALPHAQEARMFYQSAFQRFEDASFLLENDRTTGAVYLAGYSVECILKALILSLLSSAKRQRMVASFRGAKAHELDWLKKQYLDNHGPPLPNTVIRPLAQVATWKTELRYKPGAIRNREATEFLKAAQSVLEWADGRL
jgi:HEPN domain-containing protein